MIGYQQITDLAAHGPIAKCRRYHFTGVMIARDKWNRYHTVPVETMVFASSRQNAERELMRELRPESVEYLEFRVEVSEC